MTFMTALWVMSFRQRALRLLQLPLHVRDAATHVQPEPDVIEVARQPRSIPIRLAQVNVAVAARKIRVALPVAARGRVKIQRSAP